MRLVRWTLARCMARCSGTGRPHACGAIANTGLQAAPAPDFSTACGPRAGDFKGQSMHFSGGDATFEANPGVLIGKGSASGRRFTCYGEGTFQVPRPGRPWPASRSATSAP
jgi:hypothetical protein